MVGVGVGGGEGGKRRGEVLGGGGEEKFLGVGGGEEKGFFSSVFVSLLLSWSLTSRRRPKRIYIYMETGRTRSQEVGEAGAIPNITLSPPE